MNAIVSGRKRKNGHVRPQIMALEPRWMFDGAAVADAAHVAADAAAKALIPVVAAPVEIRAADPAKDGGRKEVAFIDTSVADYKTLEAGIKDGIAIVEIDGSKSGLAQMAKWAESHTGFDAIHVLSHGSEATIKLGGDSVTEASLSDAAVQAELAEIGTALKAGGDLLIYGCDVAKGADGQAFITGLASATGADVAASDDLTGAAEKGGDWDLERNAGQVEKEGLFTDRSVSDYGGLLETVTIVSGDIPGTNTGSFTKTIGGQTFTFAPPTNNFVSLQTDIDSGGLYILDYDANGGNGTEVTISAPNGYMFDFNGFKYMSDRGSQTLTLTITYKDNTTSTGTYTLNGNSAAHTVTSFTQTMVQMKSIKFVCPELEYYNDFDIISLSRRRRFA